MLGEYRMNNYTKIFNDLLATNTKIYDRLEEILESTEDEKETDFIEMIKMLVAFQCDSFEELIESYQSNQHDELKNQSNAQIIKPDSNEFEIGKQVFKDKNQEKTIASVINQLCRASESLNGLVLLMDLSLQATNNSTVKGPALTKLVLEKLTNHSFDQIQNIKDDIIECSNALIDL